MADPRVEQAVGEVDQEIDEDAPVAAAPLPPGRTLAARLMRNPVVAIGAGFLLLMASGRTGCR
jgi:hypothetical protein